MLVDFDARQQEMDFTGGSGIMDYELYFARSDVWSKKQKQTKKHLDGFVSYKHAAFGFTWC